jgi:glucokinase
MWNTKENRFMLEGNRQLLTLDNGMDWYEIPIVDLVSEALNIPTSFMQDAKAAALGEAWFGHGREASHVAFILVDAGVGAGFVINGETFDGAENKAGEFSHTVVDLHGELGTCGHRGCVSEGASEPSIFRAVRKGRLVLQRETVEDIIHRAFAGQSPDMEVIQRTLDYLSAGIANLARILDPDVVILGGRTMLCDEHMVEETRARVQEFCRPEKQIAVLPANFGLWAVSVGAAVSVLQNIYVVRSYEQYLGK